MNLGACRTCGCENDSTRIFCRNCGSRLKEDVADGTPPRPQPKPATAAGRGQAAQLATKANTRRNRRTLRGVAGVLVFEFLSLAILGALIASLVQMARSPDGLLPELPVQDARADSLLDQVEQASQRRYGSTLTITTEAANNFLASRIGEQSAGNAFGARLTGSYVVPGEQTFRFGVVQSVGPLDIHLELHAAPIREGNGISAQLTGASIGRLPIPGPLAPLFAKSFQPVLSRLSGPTGLVQSAQAIAISPDQTILQWSAGN